MERNETERLHGVEGEGNGSYGGRSLRQGNLRGLSQLSVPNLLDFRWLPIRMAARLANLPNASGTSLKRWPLESRQRQRSLH